MIVSPRGSAIQRSLVATLKAIEEHRKLYPAEAEELYTALVAHIRSSAVHVLRAGAL